MVNIELLDITMGFIEANPDKWDQSSWRCGTSFCFAGHAALLDGAMLDSPESETLYWKTTGYASREAYEEDLKYWNGTAFNPEVTDRLVENRSDVITLSDDEKTTISEYAQKALGLSNHTAGVLFSGDNTLKELQSMVEMIKEEGNLDNWSRPECTGCSCCCPAHGDDCED